MIARINSCIASTLWLVSAAAVPASASAQVPATQANSPVALAVNEDLHPVGGIIVTRGMKVEFGSVAARDARSLAITWFAEPVGPLLPGLRFPILVIDGTASEPASVDEPDASEPGELRFLGHRLRLEHSESWAYTAEYPIDAQASATVHVVRVPVVLDFFDGAPECFLVDAYYPIPLRFAADQCRSGR